MTETSTTSEDDPNNSDAGADSTTTTDPNTETDNQPAGDSDNLDDSSKSTENDSDDDDKKSADEDDNKDDAPASKPFDEDLDDWITQRKLKAPETDEERQALQDLRNEQREFTKSRQADKATEDAKSLSDEITKSKPDIEDDEDDEDDPLAKKVKALEEKGNAETTTRLQSEFYRENNVTTEEGKAILDIYKEETTRGETDEEKVADFEYWSNPKRLPTLLKLAKARLAEGSDTVVADEAAQKEREKIARESQANSPGRGAKSHGSGTKTPEQERLDRFSNWD